MVIAKHVILSCRATGSCLPAHSGRGRRRSTRSVFIACEHCVRCVRCEMSAISPYPGSKLCTPISANAPQEGRNPVFGALPPGRRRYVGSQVFRAAVCPAPESRHDQHCHFRAHRHPPESLQAGLGAHCGRISSPKHFPSIPLDLTGHFGLLFRHCGSFCTGRRRNRDRLRLPAPQRRGRFRHALGRPGRSPLPARKRICRRRLSVAGGNR